MRPILQQVAEAHRLVEAGADIIIGHHSHTLQPVERYKGSTIYYSIGNFIFDARRPINRGLRRADKNNLHGSRSAHLAGHDKKLCA